MEEKKNNCNDIPNCFRDTKKYPISRVREIAKNCNIDIFKTLEGGKKKNKTRPELCLEIYRKSQGKSSPKYDCKDISNCYVFSKDYPVDMVREIAKNCNVNIYKNVDGKKRLKTRIELCDEIKKAVGRPGSKLPPLSVIGRIIPKKFREIAEDCTNEKKNWKVLKRLGEGKYGTADKVCYVQTGICKYVLKSQEADINFFTEVYALTELSGTGIVPKIHASWICKGMGYIVMSQVYPLKFKDIRSNFSEVRSNLKRLESMGWLHTDINPDNIMKDEKGRIKFIDLGLAVKKEGQKHSYPEHPWSSHHKILVNWEFLKAQQDYHLYTLYAPRR